MINLMDCNRQWSTRPPEERFLDLPSMHSALVQLRANSRSGVFDSAKLRAVPAADNRGLYLEGPNGHQAAPSNWAFGQVARLVGAPAAYLQELPAPLAADNLNFGLQVAREGEDVQLLLTRKGDDLELRAATGPRYGRVWNSDVIGALMDRFGDGRTGTFRIPGEFGRQVAITKDNTTLYAGDRDCFVFLADEERRIEVPGRRDGKPGALARGFFVTNSETGAAALAVKTFLFDYVCSNRIVWGAQEVREISIRHSSGAPRRFVEEVTPALEAYAAGSASGVELTIQAAQAARLDKVQQFLAGRFGPRIAERVQLVHQEEEGRPIETVWDAVTGATAYARSIPWTAERVAFEEKAGEILQAVRP